jgi:hypothetical protein
MGKGQTTNRTALRTKGDIICVAAQASQPDLPLHKFQRKAEKLSFLFAN